MTDLISIFKKDIYKLVSELENKNLFDSNSKKNISIDHSSRSKKGDLSTNLLLILKKNNVNNSFDYTEYVTNYLNNLDYIENIEVAKAGFININIKKEYIIKFFKNLIHDSNNFLDIKKQDINIEFVSANPTGPIHIAHIRGAVLGDVLSSILNKVGHSITKEYYVNDAGSQIDVLGTSLYKRYQQLFNLKIELIEGEYPGEYLINLANEIKSLDKDKWINHPDELEKNNFFKDFAINNILEKIKKDLSLINVKFDKYTFESSIIKEKKIEEIFKILRTKNLIFEGFLDKPLGEEDTAWKPRKQLLFKSSQYYDDTDRPFQKANGDWTYFANDAAYHLDKYSRNYDQLINVWGSDHIGYINRMKSITEVISNKKNFLDIIICQIVRLYQKGELLKMSKRDGNFITIEEVFNKVGKDPIRYFMISTKNETPMDFDLDKVILQNKDNPVFYCQYAYARACSVLRKANEMNIKNIDSLFEKFDSNHISDHEWKIILKLLSWPYVLMQTAESKQPHRITNYLEELCSNFHFFWNKGKEEESLRFIDEKDFIKTLTKLIWINIFKEVLNEIFTIIGIESPETM
tara:strand:- start:913 stop:2646 length:1734 start_codon:yes stop_codon:yes gene_type:complete